MLATKDIIDTAAIVGRLLADLAVFSVDVHGILQLDCLGLDWYQRWLIAVAVVPMCLLAVVCARWLWQRQRAGTDRLARTAALQERTAEAAGEGGGFQVVYKAGKKLLSAGSHHRAGKPVFRPPGGEVREVTRMCVSEIRFTASGLSDPLRGTVVAPIGHHVATCRRTWSAQEEELTPTAWNKRRPRHQVGTR